MVMTALMASDLAVQIFVNSPYLLGLLTDSAAAMQNFFTSYHAVAAIYSLDVGYDFVRLNPGIWADFLSYSNDTAVMAKALCTIIGIDPGAYANMTTLGASLPTVTMIAANPVAMTALFSSSVAGYGIPSGNMAPFFNTLGLNILTTNAKVLQAAAGSVMSAALTAGGLGKWKKIIIQFTL